MSENFILIGIYCKSTNLKFSFVIISLQIISRELYIFNINGYASKGEAGFISANKQIGKALNIPGASVHWYDKPGQIILTVPYDHI